MTTGSTSPGPSGSQSEPGWQHLARLSAELVGLADEANILRVALRDLGGLFPWERAEIMLYPAGDRPGLVARFEVGPSGEYLRLAEDFIDGLGGGLDVELDEGLDVPLSGPSGPIGLLRVEHGHEPPDQNAVQLVLAFALVVSSAVNAVRTLESERRQVEDTYQWAMVDKLTTLGSRTLLVERGDEALRNARTEGLTAALLLFDVDDFKRINDTLGHQAGDRVLAEVGLRIRRGVRAGDIAVRLGGDEFAVLTGHLKSPPDAEAMASRLLAELAPPIAVDDVELEVRSSVGIAVYGEDGDTIDDLIRAADLAMYAAKGLGPGRWQRYSPSSRALALRWSTLAEDLLRGELDDQLVLHYQPQVDAWSGSVVGFEALARWDHPQLGLLGPSEFVSLAERAGLMSRLTRSVLTSALADQAALQELAPGSSLSVNISARNLLGRGLVNDLSRTLADHNVPPEHLTLEVTEPAPGISPGATDTLTGLVKLGCRVSVSEFGTGRSSLMALSRYEGIRELKLHSGLVTEILRDPSAERLVRAIIGTAHALDVRVVAEGVESSAIVTRLRELGCDVLQGFRVHPPVDLDGIREWIAAWPAQRDERLAVLTTDRS